MEIKSVNTINKELEEAIELENYEKAYKIAKENIDLNKKYIEGEYVFKNLLEEFLFKVHIKKEIKKKYPLILDYSDLYLNYGKILIKFERFEEAEKSLKLSENYNPINVKTLLELCKLKKINNNWEDYKKITLQSIKYDYTPEDLAQSFRNLAIYYFNKFENNDNNKINKNNENNEKNNKIGSYLIVLSKEFDKTSKVAIEELKELETKINPKYENTKIDEIKKFLKENNLPYEASIEVITICKSLGFQLEESKKVVPALHYFQIAYNLTKDKNIQLTIDDLNEKIERRINE